MASCPLAIQLKLEDKIPFVDAEGSCDGSVSSVGTGSILGHSTTSEEYMEKNESQEGLWKFHQNQQDSLEDHHSLNNILDTVSSSQSKLTDLDYSSADKLDGLLMSNSHESVNTESNLDDTINGASMLLDECQSPVTTKVARPTTLALEKDTKAGGYVSLSSAYASLSEQVNII